MTVVLEDMDVTRAKPRPRPGGNLPVRKASGTHPSSQRRPPTSGGRCEIGYPVDDVHQARVMWGIGGWGKTCGEDKKMERVHRMTGMTERGQKDKKSLTK